MRSRGEELFGKAEAEHQFVRSGVASGEPNFDVEAVVAFELHDGAVVELALATGFPIPLFISPDREVLGDGKGETPVVIDEVGGVAESQRVLVQSKVFYSTLTNLADDVQLCAYAVVLAGDAADGRDELRLVSEALAEENGDRVGSIEVVPGVDEYRTVVDVPRDDRGLPVAELEPRRQVVLSLGGRRGEDEENDPEDGEFLHFFSFKF